jgi:DNA polymerase alpha subunit A
VAPKTNELDEVKAQIGSVKAENVLEEDGSLRIFWLDHMEQDGVIHLVGKVVDRASGKFVSACLSVQGIKRNLFVKPRARRFRKSRAPA